MKRLILPVLIGLALAGCSQSPERESTALPESSAASKAAPVATAVAEPTIGRPAHAVIYNGEMELSVDDFDKTSASIEQLLKEHRAYLSTSHETRANGQHRQEMTLKVWPTEFLPLVTALGKLGRIDNKEISSADVTADVLDATQAASTQQAAQAKYQQLLAHAATPAEARRFEEQVRQAQADAAANQGRLQQLTAQSTWATLTLRFTQPLPEAEQNEPMPSFLVAFQRGWLAVLTVAVLLTNIWPLLVLSGLGIWAVRWWRLRQVLGRV
ncbi:MAG: DUF4349 domain-containing protein [Janthinobacterium lividum]